MKLKYNDVGLHSNVHLRGVKHRCLELIYCSI